MKDNSRIFLYVLLVVIFGIAKEELILNEEIVIITSFLLSISLVYSLTAKDISETLSARSTEFINIFEKVNYINYQILKNIKIILENIKELQQEVKRKLVFGIKKNLKNSKKNKNKVKIKIKKMHERFLNKILIIKLSNIDESIN
uniref:ATPase subunit 4 n=1 Tax=Cavenderia fasciculata TaxID=261658 RepID=B2XX83_CACFS|nr:ATPase subunit 4 [Cavenderia fasciculata]ABX45205.1 ATPase subunit 4 [Cavenderia fasciculata]